MSVEASAGQYGSEVDETGFAPNKRGGKASYFTKDALDRFLSTFGYQVG